MGGPLFLLCGVLTQVGLAFFCVNSVVTANNSLMAWDLILCPEDVTDPVWLSLLYGVFCPCWLYMLVKVAWFVYSDVWKLRNGESSPNFVTWGTADLVKVF